MCYFWSQFRWLHCEGGCGWILGRARLSPPACDAGLVCDSFYFFSAYQCGKTEKNFWQLNCDCVAVAAVVVGFWGVFAPYRKKLNLFEAFSSIEIYVFSITGNFNGGVVVVDGWSEAVNCCTVSGKKSLHFYYKR